MGAGSKHPGAMQVLGPDMSPPQSRTLFELLREQAGHFPERVAVICGERVATYRALANAAGWINKIALAEFIERTAAGGAA